MALWIGLVLGWFVLALVGALALGRVLGGLDRPLRRVAGGTESPAASAPRVEPPVEPPAASHAAGRRTRHHVRRRARPAA
jgi:hypothetical protein